MGSPQLSSRVRRIPAVIVRRVAAGARERVRIDTRSPAGFRIALGLLIVADILLRSRNLTRFYTEQGVVPMELAVAAEPAAAYSLYAFVTSPTGVAGLFVLTALVGIALAVGYYTRPMTVVAFVLVVSLDARNPFVLSFADVLFATLLAIAVLLPLGERWSVDAVASDRPRRESIAGIATALLLCQMVVMYVVNGYHKTTSELWRSGEAAVLVLGIDEITFLFGDTLRRSPELLQLTGIVWVGMLCLAWLLLVFRGRARHLFVAAFAVAHLSMAVTVRIGAFSYVCLAGLLVFVQGSGWDDLGRIGRWTRRRLAAVATTFRSSSVGLSPVRLPSVRFLTVRGRLVALARRLPRPTVVAPSRGLAAIRDRLPDGLAPHALVVATVIGVLAILVVAGGLSAAGVLDDDTPRSEVETGTAALVEFQTDWSIFAPVPRTTDRYYVFPARAADGTLVDAHTDRALSYERPYDELQRQHATYRERFYMVSLFDDGEVSERLAERLAEHTCSTYRTDAGATLTRVEIYLVTEEITRETIDDPAARNRAASKLFEHGCAGDGDRDPLPPPSFD